MFNPIHKFMTHQTKSFILKFIAAAMLISTLLTFTGYAQICGSIGFYSPVNFPVSGRLQSVAVGDFNLDGKSDLVTANAVSTVVSVLLGNGDGTFRSSVDVTAGNNPNDAAVGDFNGDSKPDVAVANSTGNNISILINTCAAAPCSSPSFAAPVNYAAGNLPRRLAVGDFNRDNVLDLTVTNENSNTVSVLLGNGNGTFRAKVDFNPIGTQPYGVSVGDFNGDNKLDMVVVNFGMGDTAAVFINTCNSTPCAAPSFAAAQTYAVGESPMGVTVADFNGDNRLDLATANYFSSDVSILLGNGNGTFQNAVNYPSASLPNNITATDLDGDSYLDLVTTVDVGSLISVFRGRGDGTFEAKVDFNVGQSGQSDVSKAVAAEDFNGDTLMDLAVAVDMFNNVSILLNGCGDPPPSASPTTTTLSSSNNPSVYGQQITFTAIVSAGGALTEGKPSPMKNDRLRTKLEKFGLADDILLGGLPSGTVNFFADGNPIAACSNVALTGGQAQCSTQALAAGGRTITAQYSGDAGNQSSSGTLSGGAQVVNKAGTSVAVASSSNPVGMGVPVTFTATVSPVAPGSGTGTGTVTFYRDGSPICSNVALNGSGQATCSTTFGTVLNYNITAQYSGDSNFTTSNNNSSPMVQQVVGPTAAHVRISGRVLTAEGRGVANASVVMTSLTGQTRVARSNSFGNFSFDDVAVGETYACAVNHKIYRFSPQLVSVIDEVADLTFIADAK